MDKCEIITLEDNNDYIILDEIENGNNKYVYMAQEKNLENIVIRKEILKDGKPFLIGFDDPEELNKAMNLYVKKYE